jgi:hypothetical protein
MIIAPVATMFQGFSAMPHHCEILQIRTGTALA